MPKYKVEANGQVWDASSPWGRDGTEVEAENEGAAARAVLAPNGLRFVVVPGSFSAHCCFDATVLDLSGDEVESICECFDHEDAVRIAAAMNASDEGLQP